MFDKRLFGQRLLDLRKKRGVSQAVVAKALGVTTTQLGDMERGKTATSMQRLYTLCQYFNVSADYLLGLKDGLEEVSGEQP